MKTIYYVRPMLFFLTCSFLYGQQGDFKDTLFYQQEGGRLFVYNYRIFEDGTQAGLIGGAFRAPADTTDAIRYSVNQYRDLARRFADGERRRMPSNVYSDGRAQIQNRAAAQFGVDIAAIIREAEKPEVLTYRINGDTTFLWSWRLLRSAGVGSGKDENVQVLERFSTRVLRLVLQNNTELVFTVDDINVIRVSGLDGGNRTFVRDVQNPNRWLAYNTGRGIDYQLVRRPNARLGATGMLKN